MKRAIIVVSLFFLLAGCVATQHTISPGADLNNFRFVHIIQPYMDPHRTHIEVTTLFQDAGFAVLDTIGIENLPVNDRCKTLIAKYGYSSTSLMTDAYITLSDYCKGGKIIYNGKGQYGMGLNMRGDVMGALKQAFMGVSTRYTGYDPSLKVKPVKRFENWETIAKTKEDLINYFDKNILNLNPIEGIWTSAGDNKNRIAIFKDDESSKRDYVATILETSNPLWSPKQVKIEFNNTAYKDTYNVTYYSADHSKNGGLSHIEKQGLLTVKLTAQDGSSFKFTFIKNYPMNVKGKYGGRFGSEESEGVSQGSGFILSAKGLVVTNYHVVRDSSEIEVFNHKIGKNIKAKLILKDENNDIALLRLQDFQYDGIYDSNIAYSITGSSSVNLGQDTFTLGYPLGDILGSRVKLSSGKIGALFGVSEDPRLFQISNPVQPGNSGGPLFNNNGELIGIVVSSLNAKYFYENLHIIPQNVNFAVKSDYLINLVSMLPESEEINKRQGQLEDKSLEEQIKLIKPFIVSIKAH